MTCYCHVEHTDLEVVVSWTHWLIWVISPKCCIYVSVNQDRIGSDNGLSPIRHQAIMYTNAGLLLSGPFGTNFSEIFIKIWLFLSWKQNWIIICEMVAILSRGTWINHLNCILSCETIGLGQHCIKQWHIPDGTIPIPDPIDFRQWMYYCLRTWAP